MCRNIPAPVVDSFSNFMIKYDVTSIDRYRAASLTWIGFKVQQPGSYTSESLMEKLQQNDSEFVGAVVELRPNGLFAFGRKSRGKSTLWHGIDSTEFVKMKSKSGPIDKEYMTLVLSDLLKVEEKVVNNYEIRDARVQSDEVPNTEHFLKMFMTMDLVDFEKEAASAKAVVTRRRTPKQAYITAAYIHIVKLRQEERSSSSSKAFLMMKVTDPSILKFDQDFAGVDRAKLHDLEVFSINIDPEDPLHCTDQIMTLGSYIFDGHWSEKALVLYGKSGAGKSSAAKSMARTIALGEAEEDGDNDENSKAFFLKVNSVEGLHSVVELINPSIPIIFEELTPRSPQDGESKPMNIQIVKSLTAVTETTTSKKRFHDVVLPNGTPRFFTSNCSSMNNWLEEIPHDIRSMSVVSRSLNLSEDVMAVFRRVAFCYVGHNLIPSNKRKEFNGDRRAQAAAKVARFR